MAHLDVTEPDVLERTQDTADPAVIGEDLRGPVDRELKDIAMLRYNRLSVAPVTPPEFRRILKLGKTSVR